jgi:hypothetical protein
VWDTNLSQRRPFCGLGASAPGRADSIFANLSLVRSEIIRIFVDSGSSAPEDRGTRISGVSPSRLAETISEEKVRMFRNHSTRRRHSNSMTGGKFRPAVLQLEDRTVPATIFDIAHQTFLQMQQNGQLLDYAKQNLNSLRQNPQVAPVLPGFFDSVQSQSVQEIQTTNGLTKQVDQAVDAYQNDQLLNLVRSLGQQQAQKQALDDQLASESPAVQATQAPVIQAEKDAISNQENAEIQTTSQNVKEIIDLGQKVNGEFVTLTMQEAQNAMTAADLKQQLVDLGGGTGGTGGTGGDNGGTGGTGGGTGQAGTLSGSYQGTVMLTNGDFFTTGVTGQNISVAGGQVSGTVIFSQYPQADGNTVVGTTPNISASVSGSSFIIHLPGGDAQLTDQANVTSSTITFSLFNSDGSSAGTITLNRQ